MPHPEQPQDAESEVACWLYTPFGEYTWRCLWREVNRRDEDEYVVEYGNDWREDGGHHGDFVGAGPSFHGHDGENANRHRQYCGDRDRNYV